MFSLYQKVKPMTSSYGMLILHGFTGTRATVAPLVPVAESLGMAWSLPQLRGHWTKPEDMVGATYQDMLADALAAYDGLRASVDHVVVVGLSVGGLITLDLATRRPDVRAIAVLAPALRYANRLAPLAPLLARFIARFGGGDPYSGYSDPRYAEGIGNYEWFPTATFATVIQAVGGVERRLGQITAPALVAGSRVDRVIPARASQIAYDKLGSRQKEIAWFERTGHEMLIDCEGEAVCQRVRTFFAPLVG